MREIDRLTLIRAEKTREETVNGKRRVSLDSEGGRATKEGDRTDETASLMSEPPGGVRIRTGEQARRRQ